MAVKISVRKMRRLRALVARRYKLPEPPDPKDSFVDQIVMTVLWLGAPPVRARLAFVNLAEEFVDWNELRVSMRSDIGSILKTCGLPVNKGPILKHILSRAIEDLYSFDFEELRQRPRAELKDWFVGIEGVPHAAAAAILYYVYQYDRMLVDTDIARVVRRLGLVDENAMEEEIEAGMVAVVPAREAHFIYSALRDHALTVCTKKDFDCTTCPLRKECEAGKRRIAEIEAAKKAARAAKKAKAKTEAAAKAKAKPEATKKKRTQSASSSSSRPKPSQKESKS